MGPLYLETTKITLMMSLFKITDVLCATVVVVISTVVVGTKVAIAVA